MPELPEVEIVRRGLGPAIMDKHVKNIILNRSDLRGGIPANFRSIIEKNRIIATQRRGKYILVFTDSGAGFVLHLGMSGGIHIHRPEEAYHPAKHDHVIFTMDDDTRVIFNDPRRFGMLYLTHAKTWEKEAPFDVMGPEPLAAAALGLVVFFAAWLIGFGPAIAVSPLVSQSLGADENNVDDVRISVRMALWAIGFLALPIFLMFFLTEHIALALGQPAELARRAGPYVIALAPGWPFAMGVIILRNFLAAIGETRAPLLVVTATTLLNAFLNWLLIYGHWGFPRLELVGAGIASSVVNICGFFALVLFIRADARARPPGRPGRRPPPARDEEQDRRFVEMFGQVERGLHVASQMGRELLALGPREQIVRAGSREDLVTKVHALDRILLAHYYVIPMWHYPKWRIAYWTRIQRPEELSGISPLISQTWWSANAAAQTQGTP